MFHARKRTDVPVFRTMTIIHTKICRQEILMLLFGRIKKWIIAQKVVST